MDINISDLSSSFRLLSGHDTSVDKVQLAQSLAKVLLNGGGASAGGGGAPDLHLLPTPVLAHYQRSLLDAVVSLLLKPQTKAPGSGQAGAGSSGGKGKRKDRSEGLAATEASGGASLADQQLLPSSISLAGNADPRVWSLLHRLLSEGSICNSVGPATLPLSLINSAATACKVAADLYATQSDVHPAPNSSAAVPALATSAASGASATLATSAASGASAKSAASGASATSATSAAAKQLITAVNRAMHLLLLTSLSSHFRPTLEQCLALMAAAMKLPVLPSQWGQGAKDPAPVAKGPTHCLAGSVTENAADSAAACQGLALTLVSSLHQLVQAHANPKKVFSSLVPKLMLPLSSLTSTLHFKHSVVHAMLLGHAPSTLPSPHHDASTPTESTRLGGGLGTLQTSVIASAAPMPMLSDAVSQLLETLLLHESHVQGLAELCALLSGPYLATQQLPKSIEAASGEGEGEVDGSGDKDAAKEAELGERASKKQKKGKKGELSGDATPAGEGPVLALAGCTTYQAALFQLMEENLGGSGDGGSHASLLSTFPWLLTKYCDALARSRRIVAAENTSKIGGKVYKKSDSNMDDHAGSGHTSKTDGSGSTSLFVDAEFQMFVVLSTILGNSLDDRSKETEGELVGDGELGGKESVKKKSKRQRKDEAGGKEPAQTPPQGNAGDKSKRDIELVYALAALLSAVKTTGTYQPTRNLSGTHRAYLERLLTQLFAKVTQPEPEMCVAMSCAVSAMLDLEHKAVQPHLDKVWGLLWSTAATGDPLASRGSLSEGVEGVQLAVAVAAARRLVGAYSELRQVEFLFKSLMESLRGLRDTAAASAAICVIQDQHFLLAIDTAVHQLPTGQCALMVSLIGIDLQEWVQADGDIPLLQEMLVGVSIMYGHCLTALRVDLSTAMVVAAACKELISTTIAGPLISALTRVCKKAAGSDGGCLPAASTQLLLPQLHVYSGLIRLHALCAAMHPEVEPLMDQGALSSGGTHLGYFAPILEAADENVKAKLTKSLKKCTSPDALLSLGRIALEMYKTEGDDSSSGGGAEFRGGALLASCVHQCVLQRIQVVREQFIRSAVACKVTTTTATATTTASANTNTNALNAAASTDDMAEDATDGSDQNPTGGDPTGGEHKPKDSHARTQADYVHELQALIGLILTPVTSLASAGDWRAQELLLRELGASSASSPPLTSLTTSSASPSPSNLKLSSSEVVCASCLSCLSLLATWADTAVGGASWLGPLAGLDRQEQGCEDSRTQLNALVELMLAAAVMGTQDSARHQPSKGADAQLALPLQSAPQHVSQYTTQVKIRQPRSAMQHFSASCSSILRMVEFVQLPALQLVLPGSVVSIMSSWVALLVSELPVGKDSTGEDGGGEKERSGLPVDKIVAALQKAGNQGRKGGAGSGSSSSIGSFPSASATTRLAKWQEKQLKRLAEASSGSSPAAANKGSKAGSCKVAHLALNRLQTLVELALQIPMRSLAGSQLQYLSYSCTLLAVLLLEIMLQGVGGGRGSKVHTVIDSALQCLQSVLNLAACLEHSHVQLLQQAMLVAADYSVGGGAEKVQEMLSQAKPSPLSWIVEVGKYTAVTTLATETNDDELAQRLVLMVDASSVLMRSSASLSLLQATAFFVSSDACASSRAGPSPSKGASAPSTHAPARDAESASVSPTAATLQLSRSLLHTLADSLASISSKHSDNGGPKGAAPKKVPSPQRAATDLVLCLMSEHLIGAVSLCCSPLPPHHLLSPASQSKQTKAKARVLFSSSILSDLQPPAELLPSLLDDTHHALAQSSSLQALLAGTRSKLIQSLVQATCCSLFATTASSMDVQRTHGAAIDVLQQHKVAESGSESKTLKRGTTVPLVFALLPQLPQIRSFLSLRVAATSQSTAAVASRVNDLPPLQVRAMAILGSISRAFPRPQSLAPSASHPVAHADDIVVSEKIKMRQAKKVETESQTQQVVEEHQPQQEAMEVQELQQHHSVLSCLHLTLLPLLTPSETSPPARLHQASAGGADWSCLLADLHPDSPLLMERVELLNSFRCLVQNSKREQLRAMVNTLLDQLLLSSPSSGPLHSVQPLPPPSQVAEVAGGALPLQAPTHTARSTSPSLPLLHPASQSHPARALEPSPAGCPPQATMVYRYSADQTPTASALASTQCLLVVLEAANGSPSGAKVMNALAPSILKALSLIISDIRTGGLINVGSGAAASSLGLGAPFVSPSTSALLCTALRCAESIVGREVTFTPNPLHLSCLLQSLAMLFSSYAVSREPWVNNSTDELTQQQGIFCSAACLLSAFLRHRLSVVQHCMSLVHTTCRCMLLTLVQWSKALSNDLDEASLGAMTDAINCCASELARVYDSISAQDNRKRLSRYCVHFLADYITYVAAVMPTYTHLYALDGSNGYEGPSSRGAVLEGAAGSLKRAACGFLDCLKDAELQHLHVVLAHGMGGARRAALSSLRQEFEKSFKYSGKV